MKKTKKYGWVVQLKINCYLGKKGTFYVSNNAPNLTTYSGPLSSAYICKNRAYARRLCLKGMEMVRKVGLLESGRPYKVIK